MAASLLSGEGNLKIAGVALQLLVHRLKLLPLRALFDEQRTKVAGIHLQLALGGAQLTADFPDARTRQCVFGIHLARAAAPRPLLAAASPPEFPFNFCVFCMRS